MLLSMKWRVWWISKQIPLINTRGKCSQNVEISDKVDQRGDISMSTWHRRSLRWSIRCLIGVGSIMAIGCSCHLHVVPSSCLRKSLPLTIFTMIRCPNYWATERLAVSLKEFALTGTMPIAQSDLAKCHTNHLRHDVLQNNLCLI